MLRGLAIALIAGAALAPAAQAAPRNGAIYYADGSELWRVHPNGSGAERLASEFHDDQFAFSPAGSRLIGVSGGMTIFDASDGSPIGSIPVTGDWWGRPSWRPNGREIAFSRCERSIFTDIDECVAYGVYRVRPDGTHLRRIAQGRDPTWSPDGRSLLILRRLKDRDPAGNDCYGLFSVRADGTRTHRLLPRSPRCPFGFSWPYYASWSPGGQRVLFIRDGNLWTMRTDGSQRRRILKPPRGFTIRDARWSPDGRRIAYSVFHRTTATNQGGIYVAKPSGGLGRRVAVVHQFPGDLAWQPIASRR